MDSNPHRHSNDDWHKMLDAIEFSIGSIEFIFVRPTTPLNPDGHGRAFDPDDLK